MIRSERRPSYCWTGPAPGFPANGIELDIPQRNFHRRVSLEGSNDLTSWRIVQGEETLYDFDTPKFVGSDRSIRFGESRYRHYRITIANDDNPRLPVGGARASGFVRKLVFSADPAQSYRLYYGNPDVSAPSYDLERVFPYLVTEGLPVAALGPHTRNPVFAVPAAAAHTLHRALPVAASRNCGDCGPTHRCVPSQHCPPAQGKAASAAAPPVGPRSGLGSGGNCAAGFLRGLPRRGASGAQK